MNAERFEEYENKERELLFRIEKSVRYHDHRKRFFELIHNWITFLVALSGTATFVTLVAEMGPRVPLFLAFAVTVFSLGDLIVKSPDKIRLYDDLKRRFIALEKKIILLKEPDTDFQNKLNADILNIEADEPPNLRTLTAICHNETLQAKGYDKGYFKKIGWHKKFLRHVMDLNPDTL